MTKRFTGLWVPAPILLSDFNRTEVTILAEVAALEKEAGCYASNAHLGNIARIKPRAVRYVLASLAEAGALVIENKGSKRRRLRLGADLKRQIAELDAVQEQSGERPKRRTRQTAAAFDDQTRHDVATARGNFLPLDEASNCHSSGQSVATEITRRSQDKNTDKNTNTAFAGVGLPEWVPTPLWEQWLTYNRENRRKVTATTQAFQLEKLAELRANNQDPVKVIKQSIEKGWASFCELPKDPEQRRREAEEEKRREEQRRVFAGVY